MAASLRSAENIGSSIYGLLSVFCRKNVLPCGFSQLRYKQKRKGISMRARDRLERKDPTLKAARLVKEAKKREERLKAKGYWKPVEEVIDQAAILGQVPQDNVWCHAHYPPQTMDIEAAIARHKDLAHPDMLDNEEGFLYLSMKLDMTTKKKTKMMGNIRNTVMLPYQFPCGKPPNICVICQMDEHLDLAGKLGAAAFGTPKEIANQLKSGIIHVKDFQHVLATLDIANEKAFTGLRNVFREMFPQRARGNMGFDLQAMWELFYNGYTFESTKITEDVGQLQVPLGLIEMPTHELVGNMDAYIEAISKERNLSLGPFIKSMRLVAPPSPDEFLVTVEKYAPGYDNQEYESDDDDDEDAKKKKKKKRR